MPKHLPDFGRFSDPAVLILFSLVGGPKHGYAMMEDIFQYSGTQLEPGTLYGALGRMEQRGWVEPLESQDRRRPYKITALGITVLQEQLATMSRIVTVGQERLQLI